MEAGILSGEQKVKAPSPMAITWGEFAFGGIRCVKDLPEGDYAFVKRPPNGETVYVAWGELKGERFRTEHKSWEAGQGMCETMVRAAYAEHAQ